MKPLWQHQQDALTRIRRSCQGNWFGFGLFMSPGTGKTRVIVEQIRYLCNEKKKYLKILILCPPVVIKQWKEEILANSRIDDKRIVCLTGSGKKRVKDFLECGNAHIFITNYESLLMPELFNAMFAWGPEVMVLDESHRIKNHSAKRTKLALRLGKIATYRYILTGSPILNSLEDIYTQMAFVKEDLFPKNFFAFRHTYMYDANRNMPRHKYFPNWKPKPDAEAALNRKIAPHIFKARKEDCLTLPPFIKKRIEVEMTPEQEKAYRQMEKQFITYMKDDSAVTAELAITKTLRMRQILSGFAKDAEDKIHQFYDFPRMEALKDLLQDIAYAEKVIVWSEFRENYSQIAVTVQNLKLGYKLLVGGMTENEREDAIKSFRTDPTVRVLIANPGAGGIGVNLVQASHMIYYSRSPSLEHDIQSEARAYRGGSEMHEKITRWDIVCPNTLDDVILKALEEKQRVGDVIVGWAKGNLNPTPQ